MKNVKSVKNVDNLSSNDRKAWLDLTIKSVARKLKHKYELGQTDHLGDLGLVPIALLIDEMEAEALDQLSYIYELRRRVS